MENPISNFIDDPNNLFERTKKAVAQKAMEAAQTDTGQAVLGKVNEALGPLAKLAVPYREFAAPAITSLLLELNSDYRRQNPNMNMLEQLQRGFELSKTEVPGEESWRRAISPGRALVGLMGNWNFAGEQGVDNLDWSNAYAVNKYFTSGSAQFWSGFADLGFNLLDPVAWAGGRIAKVGRNEFITRPISGGKHGTGRIDKIFEEIDTAVANENAKTPVSALFSLVEKNPDNYRAIRNYGIVAGSANPNRFAIALSDAQKSGGRSAMAAVLKASMGHRDSLVKLESEYEGIAIAVKRNTGMNEFQRQQIAEISAAKEAPNAPSKEQLGKMAAEEEKLTAAIEKSEKESEELLKRQEQIRSVLDEDFAISTTFSRSHAIERVRTALAEAGSEGLFLDVDPKRHFRLAKLAAKSANVRPATARAIMWLSPNQQLRETPAGVAWLGGAPGEWSWKEYDARVSMLGRIAGLSPDTMKTMSADFAKLTSKSQRFLAFEDLEDTAFEALVRKYYAKDFDSMLPAQQESVRVFAQKLVAATRRAKARQVDDLLEKNYTFTHHSEGNVIANNMLDGLVNNLASEIAAKRGAVKPTNVDIQMAKSSLRSTPITETQVPDYHFGLDMRFIDQIMSENPRTLRHVIEGIVEEGWEPSYVSKFMDSAERASLEASGNLGVAYDLNVAPWLRTFKDIGVSNVDSFYNYIWKPATLLSFKYTSRNVLEGWLRVAMSMVDMSSVYGYRLTEMVTGLRDPGSITRTFVNRGVRKKSKEAQEAYKNKIIELQDNEDLLKQQLRRPRRSTTPATMTAQDAVLSEADKKIFEENDGITALKQFISLRTGDLKDYVKTGDAGSDATRDFLYNEVRPIVSGRKGPYEEWEKEVLSYLDAGNYESFYSALVKLNPESSIGLLAKYRDMVEKSYKQLSSMSANGAGTVEYALENSKYAMERMLLHVERTMAMITERAKFQGQLQELSGQISAKGRKKRSFENNKVELIPGVLIDAALAGEAGDMLRRVTSSKASTTRTLSNEVNVTGHGLLSVGAITRPVSPTDPLWTQAHADYVNNVLMKDAVARHIITDIANGMSDGEALQRAYSFARSSDKEAAIWRRETKQNFKTHSSNMGIDFDSNHAVDVTMVQIAQHLPFRDMENGVSYEWLYEKALRGLTVEDSAKISYPHRMDVTTTIERHERTVNTLYKNLVSRLFHVIGTLPEDHLVRHPFFSMVHDNEAIRLTKKYVREGERLGGGDIEFTKAFVEANKERIKNGAVNRAYKELMQRLYTVERHTLPSNFMRFITPFYMAHQNSSRFWLGSSLRNPDFALFLAKAYNAPYRGGWVYDEQGNLVESGDPWSIKHGKDKIIFNPKWLRDFTGREYLVLNPSGVDVITQGQYPILPTLGAPIGETLGREALKIVGKRPLPGTNGLGADEWLQKNYGYTLDEFSGKFLLPYYDKDFGKSLTSTAASSLVPFNSGTTSMLAAVYGLSGKLPVVGALGNVAPPVADRWNSRVQDAYKAVTLENVLSQNPLNPESDMARAQSIAIRSLLAEGLFALAPLVVAPKTADKNLTEMTQRLNYHQKTSGMSEGAVKYIQELDESGLMFSSSAVSAIRTSSVNNRFGFYSNIVTARGVQQNKTLLDYVAQRHEDNPFIGSMFNIIPTDPKDAKYSAIADDILYSTVIAGKPAKIRNEPIEDTARRTEYNAAWSAYFDNLEYIEAHAEARGIRKGTRAYREQYKPWKDAVEAYIGQQFPQWAEREAKITLDRSDTTVALAYQFINDKNYMATVGSKNPAIKGLRVYLENREYIVNQLEKNRAATGVKGIDTEANRRYADLRDRTAEVIIQMYPEFKQMYTRYFADDQLNPYIPGMSGGAN